MSLQLNYRTENKEFFISKTKPSHVKVKSCPCKCITCGTRWMQPSNKLYSDKTNYVYCDIHKGNRKRSDSGWEGIMEPSALMRQKKYRLKKEKTEVRK
jgi:hypothetical protein